MRRIRGGPVSFAIAVVGGGFGGTILASVLERGQPAIRVVLIERDADGLPSDHSSLITQRRLLTKVQRGPRGGTRRVPQVSERHGG
jgi:choline dehydrogenase-like flavoprotein